MTAIPSMERIGRAGLAAAAALALAFSGGATAQPGGGRPATAGSMRPMPTLPTQAQVPSNVLDRQPVTAAKPEAAAAAAENAATATTTVEHTENGIVRTTTVTNQHGTMTGSTTVSRDAEAGTVAVTNSQTGFDGQTRAVENTVTRSEEGTEHTLTKDDGEAEEGDETATEETSPPGG